MMLDDLPPFMTVGQAAKALQLGLHVMMFSDNVSIEEEIPLKRYACDHDLLVMGRPPAHVAVEREVLGDK